MDSKRENILSAANLPESWRPDCYIAESGMIFTPQFDGGGNLLATGRETYEAWLEAQNQQSEGPQDVELPEAMPSETELDMLETIVDLQAQVDQITIGGI